MALKELDKSFLRHGTLSDDPDRLKRIDDYVKEFEKDYGRKPTAKNIRTTFKEKIWKVFDAFFYFNIMVPIFKQLAISIT